MMETYDYNANKYKRDEFTAIRKNTEFGAIRKSTGLSQTAFAKKYEIPLRTVQSWELGERRPPAYVINLLRKVVVECHI